jgi:uncharacterized membrane protein YdjX (TVP38/TMEM64 family)
LAVLAAGTIAVFATGTHRLLSLGRSSPIGTDCRISFATKGIVAVLAYAGVYVTAVAMSVPGSVFLTMLAGFLFGWLVGGAVAAVCATLGAVLLFLIARTSFGDILVRKAGPRLQTLASGFQNDAFSYLLFLRLLPIMPFWLTNLAAALFGVNLRAFAVATAIGILPATFTFAVAGAGLDSVIDAQKAAFAACKAAGGADCSFDLDLRTILTPTIIIAFAALAALALAPILLRRWQRRGAVAPAAESRAS